MPRKQFKTMANKYPGVSAADLERYWKEAEAGMEKSDRKPKDKNAYLMGTVVKRAKAAAGGKSEHLFRELFRFATTRIDERNVDSVVQAIETTMATAVTTGAPAGTVNTPKKPKDLEDDPEETDSTSSRQLPGVIHKEPGRFGYN